MNQDGQRAAPQPPAGQQRPERAEFRVVKTSLKSLAVNDRILAAFRTLVVRMDRVIRFSYAFARFIFVRELAYNPDEFAPLYGSLWATELFFKEIIKKVGGTDLRPPALPVVDPQGQETAAQRKSRERFQHVVMINLHWDMFVEFSGYRLEPADRITGITQNISTYAAKQMESAYLNLVKNEFGNRLRQLVNFVLDVVNLENEIKRQMPENTEEEQEDMIREVVRVPARRFKVALATALGTGNRDLPEIIQGSIFEEH